MGAVTTLPAFLDNLRARLILRAGLSGVNVYSAEVEAESMGEESIILAIEPPQVTCDYPELPQQDVSEQYTVSGLIWVAAPDGGEDAIKVARDRTCAILSEVINELRADNVDTPTTEANLGVRDARMSSWSLDQFPQDAARHGQLSFQITVKARFTPA